MRKRINDKLYDTDTATFLAEVNNGYAINDLNYYSESLYLKRTGEYFLHGEGGGLSPYAGKYGDSWGWGEVIKPLSYKEAKAWAEEKLTGDNFEDIFGDVEEDDSEILVSVYIEKGLKDRMDRYMQKSGNTMKGIINQAIDEFLSAN